MRVRVGTSGFSYKEWKGAFYPADLPASKMLAFYAEHFDAVEINNTFYRMPKPAALERWAKDVAAAQSFAFALKAPVYVGALGRPEMFEPAARELVRTAHVLGGRLGPIYVQLPKTMKKDLGGLRALLRVLGRDVRVVVEPPDGWIGDDELYAALREHGAALVGVDDVEREIPIVPTADFGYVRLRRTRYPKAALAEWADRILAQPWNEAWVFFKHEDEATGPRLARAFQRALAGRDDAVVHGPA